MTVNHLMPKYRIVQSERQRNVENQSTFAEVTAEEKYPIFDSQCISHIMQ